jgi:hypothetical protein
MMWPNAVLDGSICYSVRCQSIWVQGRLKLRDDLVHLVNVIMRRFCCVASAVLQRSFV